MDRFAQCCVGVFLLFVQDVMGQGQIPTTGMQLWLRADVGVIRNGSTVTRWVDQSGNGNDAIQPVLSRQPFMVANALNGKPAIHFDGVDDKLGFIGSSPMTQVSVFFVYKVHTSGGVVTFGGGGDVATGHQLFMIIGGLASSPDLIGIGYGSDHGIRATAPGIGANDQWRNVSIISNTSIFNTTCRWNGNDAVMVKVGTDWPNAFAMGDSAGSGGGVGGSDGTPEGRHMVECDVAEVIVYKIALPDSARLAVENYLNTKYFVSSPIPSANLQLWLRADAGASFNGSGVRTWVDLSGQGHDAIQRSISRQPLELPGSLNHLPVIHFDGVDDKLGLTGSTSMTRMSFFMVYKTHAGGDVITFGAANHLTPGEQLFVIHRGLADSSDRIGLGFGPSQGIRAMGPNIGARDEWRLIDFVTNQTILNTTLRWNEDSMMIDANMIPIGECPNAFSLGDSTGSGGGIGGADGMPAGQLETDCDVAEVIVYDTALSFQARAIIESYLGMKYSLLRPPSVTGRDGQVEPVQFSLEQNYPNPFNPTTAVSYRLPVSSFVRLTVYDILGREAAVLVDERKASGSYTVQFNASGLASGVYFYRLQAGDFVSTKRLVVLR